MIFRVLVGVMPTSCWRRPISLCTSVPESCLRRIPRRSSRSCRYIIRFTLTWIYCSCSQFWLSSEEPYIHLKDWNFYSTMTSLLPLLYPSEYSSCYENFLDLDVHSEVDKKYVIPECCIRQTCFRTLGSTRSPTGSLTETGITRTARLHRYVFFAATQH